MEFVFEDVLLQFTNSRLEGSPSLYRSTRVSSSSVRTEITTAQAREPPDSDMHKSDLRQLGTGQAFYEGIPKAV